jgi:hypothetical protein
VGIWFLIASGTSQKPSTVYAASKPAVAATHRFHRIFIGCNFVLVPA